MTRLLRRRGQAIYEEELALTDGHLPEQLGTAAAIGEESARQRVVLAVADGLVPLEDQPASEGRTLSTVAVDFQKFSKVHVRDSLYHNVV